MVSFYLVLMTLNFFCAVLLVSSGLQRQKNYFYTLSLLNILAFIFNWLSLKLLTTSTLDQAIFISRIHSAVILAVMPLFTYTFSAWSKFRYTKTLVAFITIICTALIIANAFSAQSLRYGEVIGLSSYTTIFGDSANLIVGTSGDSAFIFHSLTAINIILVLIFSFRFYKSNKSIMSFSLLTCLALQLFSAYVGFNIDRQQSNLVYLGGVPITFISVVCILMMSYTLKTKSALLDSQTQKRIALETAFARLAEDVALDNPEQFYTNALRTLYDFSSADFILIGLVRPGTEDQVDTRKVLNQGTVVPNFTYVLTGSPCEKVYTSEACYFERNVAKQFPTDVFLTEQHVESYVGMSLLDNDHKPFGVLAILFCKALPDKENLLHLMKVVSVRISAEIRRSELEKKLQKMAYFDYISTLPNRASLFDVINATFFECQTSNSQAMLMLIDLDHFGEINRKFGFDVGDQVIKQLGERLANYSSKDVFIARKSGDEFAVLLKKVNGEAQSVLNVHWSAIRAILTETCLVGNRQISVQCSMGGVIFPQQTENRFDVISCAEHAMQQAKLKGRNQCAMFNPGVLADLEKNRLMEVNLKQALQTSDELFVVYQPKVNLEGHVDGAEALIRWRTQQNKIVSPAEFIPLAERTGLIHEIGKYVVQYVCADVIRWQAAGLTPPRISINISATEFEHDGFVADFLAITTAAGVSGNMLEIELTETALLRDPQRVVLELNKIKLAGTQIALDDFGTGYSSLSYLQDLPIDVLKIDKSFIDHLSSDRSFELVKAIITIANQMGLSVVAEGTETKEQVDKLIALGCQLFQGYYFSKPLPSDDFIPFIIDKNK